MRTLLLTTFVITQLVGHCFAGTSALPEIPVSKFGMLQALTIFGQQMHKFTDYFVMSVNWCKASEFQPHIGDWRWDPQLDHTNEYSWFVTYIYKDKRREKLMKELEGNRRFNEVGVMRIKDDGKIGSFVGVR